MTAAMETARLRITGRVQGVGYRLWAMRTAEGLGLRGNGSIAVSFDNVTLEPVARIGQPGGGAELVFDYSNPPDSMPSDRAAEHEQRAARVAELGEAWLSYFDTEVLHERLCSIGFVHLDDLGPYEIARRYLPEVAAPVSGAGGHIIHAATA